MTQGWRAEARGHEGGGHEGGGLRQIVVYNVYKRWTQGRTFLKG